MTFKIADLYTNKMDLLTVGGRKEWSKKRCDTAIRPVSEDRSLPPNDLQQTYSPKNSILHVNHEFSRSHFKHMNQLEG